VRAGLLNQLIDIEERATTQDAAWQQSRTWTAFKSGIYARIRPLSGRELRSGEATRNVGTHEITIRYTEGITGAMRVKFGTRYFNIIGVPRNSEERDRMIILDCEEGLNDG